MLSTWSGSYAHADGSTFLIDCAVLSCSVVASGLAGPVSRRGPGDWPLEESDDVYTTRRFGRAADGLRVMAATTAPAKAVMAAIPNPKLQPAAMAVIGTFPSATS